MRVKFPIASRLTIVVVSVLLLWGNIPLHAQGVDVVMSEFDELTQSRAHALFTPPEATVFSKVQVALWPKGYSQSENSGKVLASASDPVNLIADPKVSGDPLYKVLNFSSGGYLEVPSDVVAAPYGKSGISAQNLNFPTGGVVEFEWLMDYKLDEAQLCFSYFNTSYVFPYEFDETMGQRTDGTSSAWQINMERFSTPAR